MKRIKVIEATWKISRENDGGGSDGKTIEGLLKQTMINISKNNVGSLLR